MDSQTPPRHVSGTTARLSAPGRWRGSGVLWLAGPLLAAGPLGAWWLAPAGVAVPAALAAAAILLAGLALLRAGLHRAWATSQWEDPLTGLPNRAGLRAALGIALGRVSHGEGFALCHVDIARLRSVNDTQGHRVGDAVLREAARRLRSSVRERDLVASLGGSQFAVLQTDAVDAEAAETMVRRLIALLSEPFRVGSLRLKLGVRGGIVLAGPGGLPVEAGEAGIDRLIGDAELALAQAKQAGTGTWRVFRPEWEDRARSRSALEADLRHALERGELVLYYQPLVNVQGRQVAGFEALLRWDHPIRGLVPPAEFIPLAEETGLIIEIGAWVLRTACAEATGWPAEAHVAVNLSPIQVTNDGLVETVRTALAMSGLSGGRLELEITESVLLDATGGVLTTLHALRGLGVRIVLDDFGTGYSSLSYLRSFPFDAMKIDRSFVSVLDRPGETDAIVRAIVAMGASLGMSITAEGVETPEQLAQLVALGCTHVQGFFFSLPRPAGDVPGLLAVRPPPALTVAGPALLLAELKQRMRVS